MKQLHNMLQDSTNWLDAKKRVDHLIKQASERLESWQEITYTVEALKKQNTELKVGLTVCINTLALPNAQITSDKNLSLDPPSFFPFPSCSPQLFVRELQQWQGQVDETNMLADKLLTLYSSDDTHKVTQVNDNMTTTWTHIRKR